MVDNIITIDFETEPIDQERQYLAPKPVGVAIYEPGKTPYYLAWGHPTGNNCSWNYGLHTIRKMWESSAHLLSHTSFDHNVAESYMEVKPRRWDTLHDTLYLLFLANPDSLTLSLKPAYEYWMGTPPTERERLYDWILANVKGVKKKDLGAYIYLAPASIVGPYACGDVVRTRHLFDYLYPKIIGEGMKEAYDRERKIQPYLFQNERHGLQVNRLQLEQDCRLYDKALQSADDWLCRFFGRQINIASDNELAKALRDSGVVTTFAKTPTGRDSTAKGNLTIERFSDPRIFFALSYRNRLATCLSTFMHNWLKMADSKNRIHASWTSIRQANERTQGFRGARTGRITSNSPPFTNIAKSFADRGDGYQHPSFIDVPPLPLIRRYILPDEGQTWVHRDYNQQELRITAHFEGASLLNLYLQNMDVHQYVTDAINRIIQFKKISRWDGKQLNLALIYGLGIKKLARKLNCSLQQAKLIKQAHEQVLPGLHKFQNHINYITRCGQPVVTWGGRQYWCEEPVWYKNHWITFEYKQINRLIQSSAADCSKEAFLRYCEHPKRQGRWLTMVYDEFNVSAEDWKHELQVLKEAMESVEFKVPMLTDAKVGPNWGELEAVKDEESYAQIAMNLMRDGKKKEESSMRLLIKLGWKHATNNRLVPL